MALAAIRSVSLALLATLGAVVAAALAATLLWWRSSGGLPIAAGVLLILLAIATAATVIALRRARVVEARVRTLQGVERQLRASEAKFSGILDIAADAIITVDERQRIVHFNKGA